MQFKCREYTEALPLVHYEPECVTLAANNVAIIPESVKELTIDYKGMYFVLFLVAEVKSI